MASTFSIHHRGSVILMFAFLLIAYPTTAHSFVPTATTTTTKGTMLGRLSHVRTKRSNTQWSISPSQTSQPLLRKANIHQSNSPTSLALMLPRGGGGGGVATTASSVVSKMVASPESLFNSLLGGLAILVISLKLFRQPSSSSSSSIQQEQQQDDLNKEKKPPSIQSLQIRFLSVFWLLRCADWLQGPYFYEVYASKTLQGSTSPVSMGLVSRLFLTGFASTALFGPFMGRLCDQYGRKAGTLAFGIIYSLGAASTKSSILAILILGRIMSGIGTSLLFSAPEAWLVGESQKKEEGKDDPDGKYLGETFGLAYAGDSIVAILAGQFAGAAANRRGPTGPFELSIGFLTAGTFLASLLWKENVANNNESSSTSSSSSSSSSSSTTKKPTIRDAIQVVKSDIKIILVGAVQSLFEAAMYIFVLQWPPAIHRAITSGTMFSSSVSTPYGTVFSCFMACCLLGSTTFGKLASASSVPTESFTSIMLGLATVSMGWAASSLSSSSSIPSLSALVAAFFLFEACVGMYFPSIGTLRSKYVPDSHRSVIMNLFGIPLNVLVVTVFLSIKRLGVGGALWVSTGALTLATVCMWKLRSMVLDNNDDDAVASTAVA